MPHMTIFFKITASHFKLKQTKLKKKATGFDISATRKMTAIIFS